MKIKFKYFYGFIKNNPQHFFDLHEEIKQFFEKKHFKSCGCSASFENFSEEEKFKKLICNEEIRSLILDKSESLLHSEVDITDFSVNKCSENDQNK